MNIAQIKQDLDNGVIVSAATWRELVEWAVKVEGEKAMAIIPKEVERDAVKMPSPCSHCTGGKVKSDLTMMEQTCHICAGTGLIWPNRSVIAAIATGEAK